MEIGYRRGFEAFEATGSDASVGSDAVAAVGGASAALVDKPRGKYAADSTLVSSGAGDHARRSSITSVALMLMMLTLALDIITGPDKPEFEELQPEHSLLGFPCSSFDNMAVALLEVTAGNATCELDVTSFILHRGDITFDDMLGRRDEY